MGKRALDIAASAAGSVLTLAARSPAGAEWIAANLDFEPWQTFGGAVVVDHRCGPDVLAGALADGLYVTLDGREPRQEGDRG